MSAILFALCLIVGVQASNGQAPSGRDRAAALAATADAQASAGRLEAAIRTMEEAERAAPDWPELKVNLAALRSQAGDYAGAIAAARAALQLAPQLEGARLNLGLAQLKSGAHADAARTLAPFGGRTDTPPIASAALGLALTAIGRLEEGAAELQRAVDAGIRDRDTLLALGRARLKLGDPDRAAALARMVTETSEHAEAWLLLGDAEDARHDWTAATTAYRAALQQDPNLPRGHYSLGLMLFKLRRYDEAARELDLELARDPDYAPALLYRAELELGRGDARAALTALERLTRTTPGHQEGWRALGRAYLDLKRGRDAVRALERAVALRPDDASGHFLLGRALSAVGHKVRARDAFARAAELNQQTRERLERRVSGRKSGRGDR